MNKADIWKILGIEQTRDENEIKTAYRKLLPSFNPEDDPEGFKNLREAYDMAMASLSEDESEENQLPDDAPEEVVRHLEKADIIYKDIYARRDEFSWRIWLNKEVVNELDTADIMREKFLAFCMGHFEYPRKVWVLFNNVFNFIEEKRELSEIFPADFIEYIIYRTEHDEFFDFDLIEDREQVVSRMQMQGIKTSFDYDIGKYEPEEFDAPVDSYIKDMSFMQNHIDEIFKLMDSEDENINDRIDEFRAMLGYYQDSDYFHPLELAGLMRMYYFDADLDKEKKIANAVINGSITENTGVYVYATALITLLKCASDKNTVSAELLDLCEEKADTLLAKNVDSGKLFIVKGLVLLLREEYQKAAETFIKALDIYSGETEAILFLKKTGTDAIEYYEDKKESGTATISELMELAWSYFRNEDIERAFETLDSFEPDEENAYGYNNLYGRCYFNQEKYEEALPYLERWVENIDELNDKKERGEALSEKEADRLKRRSFSYYMFACCNSELKRYAEAKTYFKACIELEKDAQDLNELFFYMDCYGKMLLAIEEYDEAMGIWNGMISRSGHCVPAYIMRQKTAYLMRDGQLVIDDYYNITRYVPHFGKAYALAARVFAIYSQEEDLKSVFSRAESIGVVSDELDSVRAKHLASGGDIEAAYDIYMRILDSIEKDESDIEEEDLTELYADMAVFLINERTKLKGDADKYLEQAEAVVEKGRKIDPDDKRLLWILTDIYEWTDRDAEVVYKRMMELFPDDSNIYYEFGEYFYRKNDVKNAVDYYKKTLGVNSEHRNANNRLMNIYQKKYSETEQKIFYENAVEYATRQLENVKDDYYYIERALLYLEGYEFEKAQKDAEAALEINAENVYAYNAVGLSFLRRGDFVDALDYFDKAISLEDGDTQNPYMNASHCCEALMDYDGAIEYINRCLEKYDEDIEHIDALARLYTKKKDYETAFRYYHNRYMYYLKQKSETDNIWFDRRILSSYYKQVEVKYLSGDISGGRDVIRDSIIPMLRENGYYPSEVMKRIKTMDKMLVTYILIDLGNFYLYIERDYKKALECYNTILRLWARSYRKGILSSEKNTVYPEDKVKYKSDLDQYARMYMSMAAAYHLSGDRLRAREMSNHGLKCIIKGYKDIDAYLQYGPVKLSRTRIVALLIFLNGDSDTAFRTVSNMEKDERCSFCNSGACYEKFLIFARLYEMQGDMENAIKNYRTAFEMSPDDMEAYAALKLLQDKA